ncbi:MAG: N-acetylmuramic acid 6-phosphate etherase [Pyrinomonadaceae bacterium]|nr:N-acetylmuramic acid 6-phosphate etherase [Phycisphaerales bacterium]
MPQHPPDRSRILTEQRNPRSANLHTMSVEECVALIAAEDRQVIAAIDAARPSISRFIADVEPGFLKGGRLVYVGAGTSGRLGVLDASECPPTFCVPPDRVIGLIAGGDGALRKSSEGREDDPRGAQQELDVLNLGPDDAVLGIAAGGTTPYVIGAIEYVKQQGARTHGSPITGLLTCTPLRRTERSAEPHSPGNENVGTASDAGRVERVSHAVDHLIVLETGPEVVTGSTRMKAGSATKMALNMISTTLMVRSGKVYENLMVDVRASNEKLRDRAARIIATLTGLSREESFALLERGGLQVKPAVVMHELRVDFDQALRILEKENGNLGGALRHKAG